MSVSAADAEIISSVQFTVVRFQDLQDLNKCEFLIVADKISSE